MEMVALVVGILVLVIGLAYFFDHSEPPASV